MARVLPPEIEELRVRFQTLAAAEVEPHSGQVDSDAQWPTHTFAALRTAGLMGLQVPRSAGGLGHGLLALAVATESLGRACATSGICFGMHCVATAVIAAKASPDQTERFLRPIAQGQHLATLAVSETGSGSHFYLPQTELVRAKDHYVVRGTKQFVTNGGHADSYVVSTLSSEAGAQLGDFTCLIVERGAEGITWGAPWQGFGMRGNSARAMELRDVVVPTANLLGREGDQIWYMFEVVAPYFLIAMAGTYLGVAQAALDEATQHLKLRTHASSGEPLAAVDAMQLQVADLWIRVERTRQWIYSAAEQGDIGDADAVLLLLAAKVEAAETAVAVANEAMTLCGGIAYRESSRLARLLRDARASHVMSPTTQLLKQWIGRAVLGRPML